MSRRENFSKPPVSVSVAGRQPRLSMMDRQIAALRTEQERERMRIKTREELFHDLTDFSYADEVDEYGLPFTLQYSVSDSVPDVFPVSKENVQTQEPQKDPSVTPPSE